MIKFSLGALNSMLNVDVHHILEEHHKKFISGNRSALMDALITCSVFQEPIPDWAADEILTLEEKIADNQIQDMNEFFNFKPQHKANFGLDKNVRKNEEKILGALFNHRLEGGNFTAADGLEEVAESLGVSRRVVIEVYNKNKKFFEKLPKNKDVNIGYMKSSPKGLLLELAQIKRTERDK